ncbi:hypothetical protein, partial [Streptomyces hygroscopicus]|uniref:hypothetical protein n=1 Tax=Streptomyces hygroscopicus TaxID=1912 RepID=UPI0036C4B296
MRAAALYGVLGPLSLSLAMSALLATPATGRPLLHRHERHGEQDTEHRETDDLRRTPPPGGAAERGHENETGGD